MVIFDRIREYRKIYPKRALDQNVNEALNSTLSRTINTALTSLIVLVAIAVFGGESIRGFSVALALGVAVGTYSSIFVGTPIMYDLNIFMDKGLPPKLRRIIFRKNNLISNKSKSSVCSYFCNL